MAVWWKDTSAKIKMELLGRGHQDLSSQATHNPLWGTPREAKHELQGDERRGFRHQDRISIPQSNAPKTQGRFQQGRKEANPSRTKIPKKGCRQNQAAFPKYNRQGSRVGRAYRARIAVKRGRSSTTRTPYELSVPNEHDLGEKLDVSRKARNEGRKSESFNKN